MFSIWKTLVIAGALALVITPSASYSDHLEPKESEIRLGSDLSNINLSGVTVIILRGYTSLLL